MSWFTLGAIVIGLLFVANAIAYRLRYGTFLRREGRAALLTSTRLTKVGLAVCSALTAALVVGFVARVVTPETGLGAVLLDWSVLGAYIVWCLFGTTVLGVALVLCGYPSFEKNSAFSEQDP